MKDTTKSAARDYARVLKADLMAIDDILMFTIEHKQAVWSKNLVLQYFYKAIVL
jgi:hypothetical protein